MEQGMPPQGAAAEKGGGASPQDQFTDLVSNISNGMSMLTDVFGDLDPNLAGEFAGLSDQFKALVDKAMAGPSGQAPQGQGQASAMTGAAKAVPASPAGVARG